MQSVTGEKPVMWGPSIIGSGMDWYAGYGARHSDDGNEGRLVSMYTFTESWDMWEVHPNGAEVVLCVAGNLRLHQKRLVFSLPPAPVPKCARARTAASAAAHRSDR